MLQRKGFRAIVNRYLNEDTYKSLKNAYFAIHKRSGLTSAEELEEIKNGIVHGMDVDEAIKEEKYLLKAGHGGILDKMATGVLAIGLCDGCKVLSALCLSNKRYTVTGRLGIATDTYNSKGNVVAEADYSHITKNKLLEVLKEFTGEIWQVPPAYSSLKINGRRSSDLVRSGKEVNHVPRPVMCYEVQCLEFNPPHFTLDVSCGTGFYVRSLVSDVAEALGSCAHVTALVRTKHGPFTLQDCLHPEDFTRENIIRAARECHRKYPQLKEQIRNYFETRRHSKYIQHKRPKSRKKADSDSDDFFVSEQVFIDTYNQR